MIIFLYVDDCGIASPDMYEDDACIDRLKDKGFELTKEYDFSAYLRIKFHRNLKNNTITTTQPVLIKKLVEATGMTLFCPNKTPTSQTALGSDPEGPPINENYSSVVGMLLYLSMNTRPGIAFAVSQVAWFTSNLKQSHASAAKMIIRYLYATSDHGITFTPTTVFKVDCYVDADFAGLHGREPQDLSPSACSHTGYIMFFCSCPLIWKSQLRTETALNTFHTEYVALSSAIKKLVTIQ